MKGPYRKKIDTRTEYIGMGKHGWFMSLSTSPPREGEPAGTERKGRRCNSILLLSRLTGSAARIIAKVEAIVVDAAGDGEVAVGGKVPVAVPVLEIDTQFIALCRRQCVESFQT